MITYPIKGEYGQRQSDDKEVVKQINFFTSGQEEEAVVQKHPEQDPEIHMKYGPQALVLCEETAFLPEGQMQFHGA